MLHRFWDLSQTQGTIQPLNTGFVCRQEGPARSRKNVRPLGECRCGQELLLLESGPDSGMACRYDPSE
jgi:hypothetical protein